MANAPNQPNQPELAAEVDSLANPELFQILTQVVGAKVIRHENLKLQLESETDEEKRAEIQEKVNKARMDLEHFVIVFRLLSQMLPENQ